MAYRYDMMANPTEGYEDEETRRRRLAEEQAAQQAAAAGVPAMAAGPVDPDQLFRRMIQAESGGRQFTPQGQVLTSPKGAMGVGQVMPATAMQPGYGVPSIFDLAEQRGMPIAARDEATARELLGNEQLNREFAQNYATAMQQRFGQQGGVAAYNAGPGRVGRNISANQGQLNVAQLPQETQQYLGRVMGPTVPTPEQPAAASKAQQVAQQFQLSQGQGMPGLRMGTEMPAAQPKVDLTKQAIDFYQQAQDNPVDLLKLRADENAPEFIRRRAADRAYSLMDEEVQKRRAEEQARFIAESAAAGDAKASTQMAKTISREPTDTAGKWLKATFLTMLGLPGAREALMDVGVGNRDQLVQDVNGRAALITVRGDGRPVSGSWADGTTMTQKELIDTAAVAAPRKAAEMPSVHGTPVQRLNARNQVETGLMMYDPIRRESYVQVGNQRLDTTGWTTMAQQPVNVFQQAAAGAAGKGAGEGFTPGAVQGQPGLPGTGFGGQAVPGQQGAPQGVQQGVQQGAGAAAPGARPQGGIAQQREALGLTTRRSESLNKILDEEVRPQAQAGDTVSSVRKQQFELFKRPDVNMDKIFGLSTGAGAAPGDQKWTILRDIVTGRVAKNADGTPMTGDQLSQRLGALGLTPAEQSVLAEYNIANAKINAATLKETAGPGAVTVTEQQMNKERNVDITKVPALAAYNAMAQSQFDGDRARYKGDWASSREFSNSLELDREWRKESKRLGDMYMDTARKRIEFINANGNTVNAIKEGYRIFPVPEYDPNTGTWKKTRPLGAHLGR